MKKFTIFLCSVFLVLGLATSVWATTFSGEISYGSGLEANGDWESADTVLTWDVTDPAQSGTNWIYEYTWQTGEKDLSHIDIEVSVDFDFENDLISWEASAVIEKVEGPQLFDKDGNIYGIKWDLGDDTTYFVLTLESTRAPMWGDFYAKGGGGNNKNNSPIYAYNTGFGFETTAAIADGNALHPDGKAWVLVPDTAPIPEPATMLLLGAGLIGLAGLGRKRFFKKA